MNQIFALFEVFVVCFEDVILKSYYTTFLSFGIVLYLFDPATYSSFWDIEVKYWPLTLGLTRQISSVFIPFSHLYLFSRHISWIRVFIRATCPPLFLSSPQSSFHFHSQLSPQAIGQPRIIPTDSSVLSNLLPPTSPTATTPFQTLPYSWLPHKPPPAKAFTPHSFSIWPLLRPTTIHFLHTGVGFCSSEVEVII